MPRASLQRYRCQRLKAQINLDTTDASTNKLLLEDIAWVDFPDLQEVENGWLILEGCGVFSLVKCVLLPFWEIAAKATCRTRHLKCWAAKTQ